MSIMYLVIVIEFVIAGLMLVILWFWLFRDAFVDATKIDLEKVRHRLFVQAAEGYVDFSDPRYAQVDEFITTVDSVVTSLSGWHFVFIMFHVMKHIKHKAISANEALTPYQAIQVAAISVLLKSIVRRSLFLSSLMFIVMRIAPASQSDDLKLRIYEEVGLRGHGEAAPLEQFVDCGVR